MDTDDSAALTSLLNSDPALVPAEILPPGDSGGRRRSFQGIPGIEITDAGHLWVAWYAADDPQKGEGPGNYVVLARSDDAGESWHEDTLIRHSSALCRAFDPCLWVDDSGRLWVFWAQSAGWYDGRCGVWAMNKLPGESGSQWSQPKRVCDGVMMNKPVILRNGTWILPVAVWGMPAEFRTPLEYRHDLTDQTGAAAVSSDDRGMSWKWRGRALASNRSFDEHMIVERGGGDLWMLIRTSDGIAESVSFDQGETWSVPQSGKIPHVNSRFFIRRLSSGRMLLITHNPPGPLDFSEMSARVRSHLTAWLSEDEGRTWLGGLCFDQREGISYPDAVEDRHGIIYVVYDRNRDTDQEILLASFSEAAILAGPTSVSLGKWINRSLAAGPENF